MSTKTESVGWAPLPKQKADATALQLLLNLVAQLAAGVAALAGRALELERRHGVSAPPALLSARPVPEPEPAPYDPRHRLTPREREVLDLVSDGLSSKEIARNLGIARATARCHVQNVLTKLGVGTRAQAAALAHRTAAHRPTVFPELAALTRRETEVLCALAAGLPQGEIAARLHLSPHTIRTHVQRLIAKLDVHSVLGALALARRAGLTLPPEAAAAGAAANPG